MKKKVYMTLMAILAFTILFGGLVGCNLVIGEEGGGIDVALEGEIKVPNNGSKEMPTDVEQEEEIPSVEGGEESIEPEPEKDPEPVVDSDDDEEDSKLSYKKWKGDKNKTIYVDKERDDVFVLEKSKDKDFVVVNLADIQITSYVAEMQTDNSIARRTIENAIKMYKPDLITLSGDQSHLGLVSLCYAKLTEYFDSLEIPWALVFGNHEHEFGNLHSLGKMVTDSDWGIFVEGDTSCQWIGNYSINIVEEGTENIVHSIVMMNSGDYEADYGEINYYYATPGAKLPDELSSVYSNNYNRSTGVLKYGKCYSSFPQSSINWYENRIQDTATKAGKLVESTAIFHIAVPEFAMAICDYAFGNTAKKASMQLLGLADLGDTVGCGWRNTGMFAKMKSLGSTKNIIVGHDHNNAFSLLYEGIRLTYSVKTGPGCYWAGPEVNGCTALKINQLGNASIVQHFYNPNKD